MSWHAPVTTLNRWTTGENPCEYLHDRPARLEYELVARLSPEEYEARMNAGWRKFGHVLFHPVCTDCRECRPIRIPVAGFTLDRSQRRVLKHCRARFEVRFATPTVDDARLRLYNRYHAQQEVRKGWPASEKSADDYHFSFVQSPLPAVEISVWEGEALRSVVLTDLTPNVVSGVYHYYDPDLRDAGIGVFSLLQTIDLAHLMGKTYAYFGFYVAGCASLSYKARFRPCEILGDDGVWRLHP